MSSISIFTHPSKIDRNGEMKVYLRITHNGGRFMVSTGLTTSGELNGTMFPKSDKNRNVKKKRLDMLMSAAEEVLIANVNLTAKQVKPLVQKSLNPTKKTAGQNLTDYPHKPTLRKSTKTPTLKCSL